MRYARLTTIQGTGGEIGTIRCLPEPIDSTPRFGADVVAARADSIMIAADLSPVTANERERVRQRESISISHAQCGDLPPGGLFPDWARSIFSPFPLSTRGDPALIMQAATTATGPSIEPFIDHATTGVADLAERDGGLHAQEPYLAVHRNDETGLRLLAGLFGRAWAQRYLETVLFPIGNHGQ